MICLVFSNACQVLIAEAMGAGKRREASSITGTLFVFITSVAILLTALVLLGQGLVLDLMGETAARKAGFPASPLEEGRMPLLPSMSII